MPTRSKKYEDFVRSPMKDPKTLDYKDVQAVAGIGPKAAEALEANGFKKAYHLLVGGASAWVLLSSLG